MGWRNVTTQSAQSSVFVAPSEELCEARFVSGLITAVEDTRWVSASTTDDDADGEQELEEDSFVVSGTSTRLRRMSRNQIFFSRTWSTSGVKDGDDDGFP